MKNNRFVTMMLALCISAVTLLSGKFPHQATAQAVNVQTFSVSSQGDIFLSDNFQVKEFACKDGSDTVLIDLDLVWYLQQIRDYFGTPVIINSGYRTPERNANTPGAAKGSYHMKGQAADIAVRDADPWDVAKYAESLGMQGIGVYKDYVHVDTRSSSAHFFWRTGDQIPVDTFGGTPSFEPDQPEEPGDIWNRIHDVLIHPEDDLRFDLPEGMLLREGDCNEYVGKLQRALMAAGYDLAPYYDDNIFGDLTKQRVLALQRKHGLEEDGIFGALSLAALMSELSPSSQTDDFWNKAQEALIHPKDDLSFDMPEGMLLREGDCNEYVGKLQRALMAAGYDLAPYYDDNIFGDLTKQRVLALQRKHGLEEDGIFGALSLAALMSELSPFSKNDTDSLVGTLLDGMEQAVKPAQTTDTSSTPDMLQNGIEAAVNAANTVTSSSVSNPDSVTTTTSTTTTTTSTTAPIPQLAGDLNCDYTVTVSDAVLLSRMLAEDPNIKLTEQGIRNADLNNDGLIDTADSTALLRSIAGMK